MKDIKEHYQKGKLVQLVCLDEQKASYLHYISIQDAVNY